MTYETLQLALSPTNPDHIKIAAYLDGLEKKRYGYRSRLVEKALLMYIEHQEVRGTDSPEYWNPLEGHENQTIILKPQKGNSGA